MQRELGLRIDERGVVESNSANYLGLECVD